MHRIAIVFVVTAGVLITVFSAAERYANRTAIPRYCEDEAGVVNRIGIILTAENPIGEGPKKPFIIAAKLIFLVPQKEGEDVAPYLARLRRRLSNICAAS